MEQPEEDGLLRKIWDRIGFLVLVILTILFFMGMDKLIGFAPWVKWVGYTVLGLGVLFFLLRGPNTVREAVRELEEEQRQKERDKQKKRIKKLEKRISQLEKGQSGTPKQTQEGP